MRAVILRRATRLALLCLLLIAAVAQAQFRLRTVPVSAGPPANPSALINFAGWDLGIPTSRALSSGTGSPYAGGELKYDCSTATSIARSENATVVPIGTYSSDWFKVQQAPDGQYEVLFTAPIWGSPSSPCGGGSTSDHTRSELRQLTAGPTNSGASKGDFKIADRGRITWLGRPLRFPDKDRNNIATTTGNNLTVMQIHPISDAASSSVFSILLLRKNGELQATLTNADGTSAATTHSVPIVLLTGVQLGDLLWIRLTTESDRLEWEAENRTRAAGTIVTLTQSVPNVSSGGLTQRTRFQYFKAGAYHGTQPDYSSDAPEVTAGGVLDPVLVSDFAAVAVRSLSYEFLGP